MFKENLFERHKAERRARIQKAARELVAKRGYDGLTMRDLAEAAHVAVPTLYNLFGSKDSILVAELQSIAATLATVQPPATDSFLARGQAVFEAGMRVIEDNPAFFRAAIQMFQTSPETGEARRRTDDAFVAIMQANLTAAQRAGQLAAWADPATIARHMHAVHMAYLLAWGAGDIDFATFKTNALSAASHVLAGVTLGAFHEEVIALLKEAANADRSGRARSAASRK